MAQRDKALPAAGTSLPTEDVDQAALDAIAEEFLSAIRDGHEPRVDTYVDRYPDAAVQLRELLCSIQMIEQLKSAQTQELRADTAASSNPLLPPIEQLGDYQVVREIGRGGMGVVFEAMHQSLGRRVAIKVLLHSGLDDSKQLSRFRTEARAAAKLRHSNIVPVFGVGSDGNTHYYVMDFIEGESLKRRIDRLAEQQESPRGRSADENKHFYQAAEFGNMIAGALAYAHRLGVLHRDIKPANLLVDHAGQCWVADFGLAKLLEQEAITRTGDILGTPQYMPPEAFRGEYDARSEVYALGLTLYELVAMKPAIDGKNAGDILRRASKGLVNPLRKDAPALPRDLETIILKCLAESPAARYQTAALLRDDLQRYLSRQPVRARRSGPLIRCIRWTQRQPIVAGLTLTSFALLLALALVSAAGYFSTRSALNSTRQAWQETETALQDRTEALELADKQQRRAESNLQVALRAFSEITEDISARNIESDLDILGEVADTTVAGVSDADAAMLHSLLGFFDELSQNNSSHLLKESAQAARYAADIYVSLGQLESAGNAYLDAITRYSSIDGRDDASIRLEQVTLLNQLAVVYSLQGQLADANDVFESATELIELSLELKGNPEAQFQHARARRLFASLASRSGLDASLRAKDGPPGRPTPGPQGREPRKRGRNPGFQEFRDHMRRSGLRGAATQTLTMMRTRLDEENVDLAIDALIRLVDQYPGETKYKSELAHAYRNRAEVLYRQRQRTAADEAIEKSIIAWEELLNASPESQAIRYGLASTLVVANTLGLHQLRRAVRAHEITMDLLRDSPDLPRYQALRGRSLENLAAIQSRAGNDLQADRFLRDATAAYKELHEKSPEISSYAIRLSGCYERQAEAEFQRGNSQIAVGALQTAIEMLTQASTGSPKTVATNIELRRIENKLRRLQSDLRPNLKQD